MRLADIILFPKYRISEITAKLQHIIFSNLRRHEEAVRLKKSGYTEMSLHIFMTLQNRLS